MSSSTLTLPAFAKINLSLRVLGKRPDGYHELDTVLQTISLHDTIKFTVTDTPEIVLSCDDRSLPAGADNLLHRAAESLRARFAPGKGARVTILALAYLWQVNAKAQELLEIACSLGADVPFFLCGGTARGVGTGKDLTPWSDASDQFLLVIKPKANIATAEAYRSIKARTLTTGEAKTILSSSERGEISDSFDPKDLQNDFEPAVFDLAPEIKRVKVALMKAGAEVALLAGSGSAVFGVFDNGDAQERAIQMIELEAGWRVFLCRTVGRSAYRSAMGPAGEIFALLFGR